MAKIWRGGRFVCWSYQQMTPHRFPPLFSTERSYHTTKKNLVNFPTLVSLHKDLVFQNSWACLTNWGVWPTGNQLLWGTKAISRQKLVIRKNEQDTVCCTDPVVQLYSSAKRRNSDQVINSGGGIYPLVPLNVHLSECIWEKSKRGKGRSRQKL